MDGGYPVWGLASRGFVGSVAFGSLGIDRVPVCANTAVDFHDAHIDGTIL